MSEGEDELSVSGNLCKRGEEYALREYRDPHRMLTSTVKIEGGTQRRLPVISDSEIPKRCMKECLDTLYSMKVKAPVYCGEVVVTDINGLGVNIVASRSILKGSEKNVYDYPVA
jgi:CxxC motif-containing protein